MVNEAAAERFWPGEAAVGRFVRVWGRAAEPTRVVGLVRTGKYSTLGEEPRPLIYFPRRQSYRPRLTVHIRTTGNPLDLAAQVRGGGALHGA